MKTRKRASALPEVLFFLREQMDLILEGIGLGLVLSVSIGPIFFALVQTSLRQGLGAGVFVGSGIWVSDFLFILFTYLGISSLTALRENEIFLFWFSLVGGLFLLAFGLILFFKKPPSLEELRTVPQRDSSILSLWGSGFLVNTLNPFTIFFWLTTMTNGVVVKSFSTLDVIIYFGSIMGVIVLTDFLKAYFANALRKHLQPVHLKYFGWLSGVIVMCFASLIIYSGVTHGHH
ncbi:MAG: LysE family translocator [Saprospiraceae bacterium]